MQYLFQHMLKWKQIVTNTYAIDLQRTKTKLQCTESHKIVIYTLDSTCGCTTNLSVAILHIAPFWIWKGQNKWTRNRINSEKNMNISNQGLISYSASPPSMVGLNAMLQRRWDKLCVSAHAVPSPLTTRDTTSSRN